MNRVRAEARYSRSSSLARCRRTGFGLDAPSHEECETGDSPASSEHQWTAMIETGVAETIRAPAGQGTVQVNTGIPPVLITDLLCQVIFLSNLFEKRELRFEPLDVFFLAFQQ